MKRYGNLWVKICDYDNLLRAHRAARKGKSHYKEVKMINENEDFYIRKIQKSLLEKTFTTSEYVVFDKFDGTKNRTLHKLPYYPDRIVQHALIQIIGPIWDKSFIRDTFQSIPGRGTHDARKRVEKQIKNKSPQYALKFDIEKFYPSINNDVLKQEIRRKIKCKDTLWLIDDIINSCKGLPIGNYTSQYFGNIYLFRFDWKIIQKLKPNAYFRYCDDIVIICDSSNTCHNIKNICFGLLESDYLLSVKQKWQVFSIDYKGLDFVGFIFKSSSTKLRKRIRNNFKEKINKIKNVPKTLSDYQIINGLASYWGWFKHTQNKKIWFINRNDQILKEIYSAKERLNRCL